MYILNIRNFLFFVVLYMIYFSEEANSYMRCKRYIERRGKIMPRGRRLMDLTTFRTEAADRIWKPFYFGSIFPEEFTFFKGDYRFTFPENDTSLVQEFFGVLPNGTCVDETTAPGAGGGIPPQDAISKKAEFIGNSYMVFLKSRPADRYLVSVECFNTLRPVKRCPIENYSVVLYVLSPRPDSVPLHRALKDIWRSTCLTLDYISGDFRFQSYLAKIVETQYADSYLISLITVLYRLRPVKRCPIENYSVVLYVLSPRPDSVPLHRALKDIWRSTCLTLDYISGDFRFQFLFGENICPSL